VRRFPGARARAYGGNIVILVDSLAADSVFDRITETEFDICPNRLSLEDNSFGVWKAADGLSAVERIAMTPKRLIIVIMSGNAIICWDTIVLER
jgi:hypothetical protein